MNSIEEKNAQVRSEIVNAGSISEEKLTELNEEKSPWEFTEKEATIGDMMKLGIELKEIFEIEGIKLPIKWTSLIKLVNHRMTSGDKLTLNTPLKEGLKAYSSCMAKGFF